MESGEIYSTDEDEEEEVAAEEEAAAEDGVVAAAPSPPPAALQRQWSIAAQIELAQVLPAESSMFHSPLRVRDQLCMLSVLSCICMYTDTRIPTHYAPSQHEAEMAERKHMRSLRPQKVRARGPIRQPPRLSSFPR
jgi:hypothetical protein